MVTLYCVIFSRTNRNVIEPGQMLKLSETKQTGLSGSKPANLSFQCGCCMLTTRNERQRPRKGAESLLGWTLQ